MSTYTQIIYQIVFSTKDRQPTLNLEGQEKLYRFIWGILQNNQCHLYRINGMEDHIHLVTGIHPSVSLSKLVKDIKLASSDFIKKERVFTSFNGWQEGYGGFSYSISAKDHLIEYVKNQKEHHKKLNFREEYLNLSREHHIEFDEKYLF
jgi:REP element-mobilizing transposase RayT